MEIIPLGAGFAAQLRGVTLAEIAADDAAHARGDRGALGPCLLRTRMITRRSQSLGDLRT